MSNHLLPTSAEEYYGTITMIRRLLLEHGLVHWKKYLLAFVLMAIVAAGTALPAYLLGKVVNQALIDRNFPGVLMFGISILVIFTIKGLATYGQGVLMARIGNSIVAENQRRVFDKLLNESLEFFANRHTTEFIARVTTGAAAVSHVLNMLVTSVGRDALSLIALLLVMVVQDPVLSLVSLLVAPPALFILRMLIRRIYAIARRQFHGGTQIIETLQETLQGLLTVKSFTLENVMRARFNRNVDAVEYEANKMARVANRASPMMELLGGVAVTLAIIYGGYRITVGGSSPGEFLSFIAAFLLAYEPAKRLARLNIELSSGLVGVRVLFEILDSPPTEVIEDSLPPLQAGDDGIKFLGVGFAYRQDEAVLRKMSFSAAPGKMTALVGPSGGGKSTIFKMILRFYDPDRGTISIGGKEINKVSRTSLRQHVAYIGQDVFLFRGTIRDNIGFGKIGASEAEIVAAAKAAHADEFIARFPKGYDTDVGELGSQLSGGQRQRIAIARALIKNASIILFDEATAALDSESELAVREAMDHLIAGKTTLVIAHRLHTIAHAQMIHVIESGDVVESGTHDELLRKGGRYSTFYRLQLKDQAEPQPAGERMAAV